MPKVKPDLDDLTIFVITIGGPTLDKCLQALEKQNANVNVEIIRNMAPMSAAFQAMIDRCKTRYYIQVDEDMILRPYAARRMWRDMRGRTNTALVAHALWDAHLERSIMGVKIYDHEIMRKFPYRDVLSCECDQMDRIKAAGHVIHIEWGEPWEKHQGFLPADHPGIKGDHGTGYTMRSAYERYLDLTVKYRRVGQADWVSAWPRKFIERYRKNGKEIDLWSFLGCMVGLMVDPSVDTGEKDFRKYSQMKEFAQMVSHNIRLPRNLNIHVTSKCNLECPFCMRQAGGTYEPASDMTMKVIRKIYEVFPMLETACLAGFGEPLMNPQIGRIANDLLARNQYVSLITNGVLVPKVNLPYEKFGYVNVSFNASTREEYAEYVNSNKFDAALAGFRLLVRRGVNAGMSFVVDKVSMYKIPQHLNFAAAEGAKFVSIMNILPHHDLEDEQATANYMDRVISWENVQNFRSLLEEWQAQAKRIGVRVNAWPTPIDHAEKSFRLCRSPMFYLAVNGDGSIGGCNRVMPPLAANGSIYEGPDIWYNKYFTDLRAMIGGDGYNKPPCTMCFAGWKHEN